MSSTNLPKLSTEPTKIEHIFRKKVFQKSKFSKDFSNIFQRKKSEWFRTLRNDFENQNLAIFEEIVDNFGRSDDDMIYNYTY